jgi:hypothetical protein
VRASTPSREACLTQGFARSAVCKAAGDDADDKLSGNFFRKELVMGDARVDKLARILVDYSIEAGEGDQVLVSAEVGAGPLIGALYAQSGGKNDSSVHTDLVCDVREGGELYADEELIQEDGRFQEFDLAGVNDAR